MATYSRYNFCLFSGAALMRGQNVMELNDLRKIICLKKLKYLLKEFQFIVIENLVEHGRHCALVGLDPSALTSDM